MGSIDLETANMYSEDEDYPRPAELPPLSPTRGHSPTNGEATSAWHDEPQAGSGGEADGGAGGDKPKRMVRRNPQPKLDPARLTSDRGIPTILKNFEQLKFKGKGHELRDLNLLMGTMEHWANRLYPKMTFDEVIERIEKLGKKSAVQVCVKKIRMDMPLLDEDFVEREGDEVDDVARGEAPDEDDVLPNIAGTAPGNISYGNTTGTATTTTPGNVSYGNLDISEDQKKRMEENKRKAMEKRLARMQNSQSQNITGITADELPNGAGNSNATNNGIDSDEEDLANEMWNDLMSSQMTSTQKLNSGSGDKAETSKKPSPPVHSQEYDDETDDDDDYEDYLHKLKLEKETVVIKDVGVSYDADDLTNKMEETDASQSLDNEQSLSILNYDDPPSTNDGGEQSRSILEQNQPGELDSTSNEIADNNESKGNSQKEITSVENTEVAVDPAKKVNASDSQEETQAIESPVPADDDDNEEATCLPEADDHLEEAQTLQADDEATCLPENYSEDCEENMDDAETQLPEQDIDTVDMATQGHDTADQNTVAMATLEQDTADQDTVAMPTEQDMVAVDTTERDENAPLNDTSEAETMEFEPMDVADAETEVFK